MDTSRLAIIVGMGVVTYLIRVIPQLFFAGRSFPAGFDRYLRYLSYALMSGIVSVSLFFAGPRFEAAAAPGRGLALACAVLIALWSRNALWGLGAGIVTLSAVSGWSPLP